MGFETTILPLTTPQVAIYNQPAVSFSAAALEKPVFGEKPRPVSLDSLIGEPQYRSRLSFGNWLVYDEKHLFNPHLGQSLYLDEQNADLHQHMAGKRYGENYPARLLPRLLAARPSPRLEQMKAHVLEHGGLQYLLEAVSPAQEFLFRRVGRPNWSGFGEDHLIVFKKAGEWMAENQTVATQRAGVDNVGDGTEAVYFEHKVLSLVLLHWAAHKIVVPVHTTNGNGKELPTVDETLNALRIIPPLLLGGLQSVELVDEERDFFYGQMDPKGIIYLYRGSRDKHLYASLFHEAAHWFAMRVLGSVFLAEQAHWIRAMMKDAHNPSLYATTTLGEDFAESAALYFLTNGGREGMAPIHFRNRFALLDQLFYDCFTPAYRARYSPGKSAHSPVSI